MRETDSIDKKLFRDTIAQYVTEESDPDKVDYVHRLILLTIGDHAERDEFRYGRMEAEPVPAHGTEGDIPSALDSYLDEIAGTEDWKGQEEPETTPTPEPKPKAQRAAPARKPAHVKEDVAPKKANTRPQRKTKDAGQDVKASVSQPTPEDPKQHGSNPTPSTPQHPKRKLVTGRDDNKHTPFAKEIAEGKFVLPLKDKNAITAELKKFGFGKEDFDLMKRYCSDHNKKQSFQWAKLLKAAYTDKRNYGTITTALLHLNGTLPKAKYEGFLKYDERFKRHATWLRWLRAKERMKSHYAAKEAKVAESQVAEAKEQPTLQPIVTQHSVQPNQPPSGEHK